MGKSPEAFRTISEVATDLNVPKHVLRFWEGKFAQLRPMKRGGGRRYYRPEDVELLRGIRQLLYSDGYTIKGVQKILREQGIRFVMEYLQLSVQGNTATVRDIPDIASDAAKGASDPYVPNVNECGNQTLPLQQIDHLRGFLESLHQCKQLLAEAKK